MIDWKNHNVIHLYRLNWRVQGEPEIKSFSPTVLPLNNSHFSSGGGKRKNLAGSLDSAEQQNQLNLAGNPKPPRGSSEEQDAKLAGNMEASRDKRSRRSSEQVDINNLAGNLMAAPRGSREEQDAKLAVKMEAPRNENSAELINIQLEPQAIRTFLTTVRWNS
jgi:hypothetical protein